MSRGQIILGIALFALTTAVLYVWGLRKAVTQQQDLERILQSKCAGRVLRQLKKQGTMTQAEMARMVSGVSAGEFWSKRRASVSDPAAFAAQLATFLTEQQYIEPEKNGYRLKK